MPGTRLRVVAAVVAAFAVAASPAFGATKKTSTVKRYTNCAKLNAVYSHGVGKSGARDKVGSSSKDPVTNFKVSTSIYNAQLKTLDRDKDGIACEKQ